MVATDWLGRSIKAVGSAFSQTQSGSPYSGYGSYIGGSSGGYSPAFGSKQGAALDQFNNVWAKNAEAFQAQQAASIGSGGSFGGISQWDTAINQAANQFGVPANLIKAVMMRESGGQNLAANESTAVGPMQVTTSNWSNLGYDLYDPGQNILAGAKILSDYYHQMDNSWEGAVRAYLAGPGGAYKNVTDSFGTDPNSYWNDVNSYWNQFNTNTTIGATGHAADTSNFGGMFGQYAQVPDWGGFNVATDLPYYSYGSQYGLSGTTHTGLDVPMPIGTPYKAPMGGRVMCAGTGNGVDSNGGSCAAFNCEGYCAGGQGAGRVEVMLDSGVVLIFGHSSSAALAPGARFSAGTVLGTSGGENSAHVHLEARVRDGSTPSGWRIIDPRQALGGGMGAVTSTPMQTNFTPGFWWQNYTPGQ